MTIDRETPFSDVLTSVDELRTLYRAPLKAIAQKKASAGSSHGARVRGGVAIRLHRHRRSRRAGDGFAEGRAGRLHHRPRRAPTGDPRLPGNNLIDVAAQHRRQSSHRHHLPDPRSRRDHPRRRTGVGHHAIRRDQRRARQRVAHRRRRSGRSGGDVLALLELVHPWRSLDAATWREDASSTFIEFIRSALPPHAAASGPTPTISDQATDGSLHIYNRLGEMGRRPGPRRRRRPGR